MKVFGGNYDGRYRRIVAAKTKKEAAALVGVGPYQFREHFCATGNDKELATALAEPGVVFQQAYSLHNAPFERVKQPDSGEA